jgi:hypothetical protein
VSPLKQRLVEDRAMRDAARAIVETDLAIIKGEGSERGVAERLIDGGRDLARTLGDGAMDMAGDDRGKLGGAVAIGIAGIAAWLFRGTIMDAVESFLARADEGLAEAEASSEMEEEELTASCDATGASDE